MEFLTWECKKCGKVSFDGAVFIRTHIVHFADSKLEGDEWQRRQTPSHSDPAPRPGSTRPAPLKSHFLAVERKSGLAFGSTKRQSDGE
jgi:hypothetical protein